MQPKPPREFFGSYHLLGQVGTGGAAQVFKARHIHPAYGDRTFSLKLLHHEIATDREAMQRFRREAYVLAMLEHPNVVRTFEAGVEGDEPFIAMEYVDGCDLHEITCRHGDEPLPRFIALHVIGEILKGLVYAHGLRDSVQKHLRLVHRDVKPSNILVAFSGEVKLADFGVASLLGAGRVDPEVGVLGTKGYVAPEVLRGEPADHRADLYAVGIILYELVCGISPFEAERTSKFLRNAARGKVHRPRKIVRDLPPEIEEIILRALERRPERRFADAGEMLAALTRCAPSPKGLSLAVASFVRGLFATEAVREMRGSLDRLPTAPRLVIYGGPANNATLAEALSGAGNEIDTAGSVVTLERALRGRPDVVLVDLNAQGLLSGALGFSWGERASQVPVIATCDELDPARVRAAVSIGACDILVAPHRSARVVTAVQTELLRAASPASADTVGPDEATEARVRVRVVSTDEAFAEELAGVLVEWGYRADVSSHPRHALEETQRSSHHGVIYDLGADASGDLAFADRFRRCPGMAAVPVVYLAPPRAPRPPLPELCAICSRADSPATIIAVLNELRLGSDGSRVFRRFGCDLEAKLRYGGRSFAARAVDLSRGGLLLRCLKIPPVGRAVRITLIHGGDEIEMPGVMVRVEPPQRGEHGARLAIAFRLGSPRIEARLVGLIGALSTGARLKSAPAASPR